MERLMVGPGQAVLSDAIAESVAVHGFWTRSRKAGAVYLVLGAFAAAVFGPATGAGETARFTLSVRTNGAGVDLPARPFAIAFGVLCALVGIALLAGYFRRHFGLTTAVAIVTFVLSFLCWQVAGDFLPLVGLAQQTLFLAVPLILGSLAGVLGERSGVINVAIEGQLLMGAFCGALFGSIAASAWVGLIAASLGGLAVGAILAVLAIRYLVDQVVLGVVLNVFAMGITGYLYDRFMQPNTEAYNNPPIFGEIRIPLLADIPVLGPVLFQNTIITYLAIVLVIVVSLALSRTRWGLRTRAVGEHPSAADTVGIRVRLVRYRNVLIGGAIAGIGGAALTVGSVGQFGKDMSNGRGFIALAALIFGRWSPTGALAGALLFGFADALQSNLSSFNSVIPSQFLTMLPYVATILAVAGLVGKVRAPAADGQPYVKG
jgi:general nucleoside transport system permease protein